MATSQDAKDLESFLNKVEQLESIMKGLNSSEDKEREDAMKKADDVVALVQSKHSGDEEDDDDLPKTKTGFSKTVINSSTSSTSDSVVGDIRPISQGVFMAAMEQDAAERAERRRLREKEANEIKERGNVAFHRGDYLSALELYTKGLSKQKDNLALYTNRAQTNIKLKRFEDALVDCEWALKVNPLSIKAYIHMGRSHLGLKHFQKARDNYNEAIRIDPRKEKLIKDYIAEVDRAEVADRQEREARAHFECGEVDAQGVVKLIEKVGKSGELPLYYSGGFRVIASLLNTTEDKTLFRTHGGLAMTTSHPVLSRCLNVSVKSLTQEERDVLCAAFDMFTAACTDNEANQQHIFDDESLAENILKMLESKVKCHGRMLKTACVNLLHTISISDIGRKTIVTKFDICRLMSSLFTLMRCTSSVAPTAAALLNNIALEKKFKTHLRDHVDDRLLPAFKILAYDTSCTDGVMSSCLSTIMNLAGDQCLRAALSNKQELWECSLHLLDVHKTRLTDGEELIAAALGLLMNLSVETGQCVRQFGQRVCEHCLRLSRINPSHNNIIDRSLGLAGHILPHCVPAIEWVCSHDGPRIFLQHIMSDSEVRKKSCIKSLTACTQLIDSARHSVVDHKGLFPLMALLKHEDEVVAGNAALCLSHCCQVQKAATDLVQTSIIKDLLTLTRDGKRAAVQQNCAILIAKLAQADNRHLDRLRELHGIEILTSCVKF